MFRVFLVWLLMLGALCRPCAFAAQLPPEPRLAQSLSSASSPSHLALHAQKKAHHHHADGSIAVDDSRESVKHVLIDGSSGAVADFPPNPFDRFVPMASAPPAAEQRAAPEPFLPHLKRPPRPAA